LAGRAAVVGTGIAINASIVGGNPTGLGIYSINLIRALDRLRDDFIVYTSSSEAFQGLRARIQRVPAAVRPDFGMRGHLVRILWLQSMLRVGVRRAGLRALLNTMPEGIAGLGIPQVTVVHDLLPLRFPPEYPRQQYYFRYFVPRILRTSRVVVTDSESTCRDVVDHYGVRPTKLRVVYPGYDPAVFARNGDGPSLRPSGEPYFLYVGNLLPHKNVFRLLDAFAIVRRRRPCQLVIRGEGRPSYVRALRDRVETLGLGDAVTFLSYVDERSLCNLYTGAACFVLPSLGEGFGLTILEAMACGTAVVAASASSLPEVAGDAALMVDPYDGVSLADAMYRVLTDDGLQKGLRQRGLERVGSFSWRSTAETISTLLDDTLA
jgi:glycosyltransferase involved in cell wall biosynthesis